MWCYIHRRQLFAVLAVLALVAVPPGRVVLSGPSMCAVFDTGVKPINDSTCTFTEYEVTVPGLIRAADSVLAAQDDLTGTWSADDRGIYYVRQIGNMVWWTGMGPDRGLSFTNIFTGTIEGNPNNPSIPLIRGTWADVPRGINTLRDGALVLERVSSSQLRKQAETGGFGGSVWTKVVIANPPCQDIVCKFNSVRRNDNGTMHDHLKMYKDNVVVFGSIIEPLSVNFPANVSRGYDSFMCPEGKWWPPLAGDPPDGDINFRIVTDRANLDAQPNFWNSADGWFNSPNHIIAKLDNLVNEVPNNQMHPEVIMYGRPAGKDNCAGNVPVLLPGWMESDGNSVLLNGRPINGQLENGPPVRILGDVVPVGPPATLTHVRVTGFLALDCHGVFGDCEEDDPSKHNVEIHPVYAIDVVNPELTTRAVTLTGAWAANDVGTYYMRQTGDAVWWLGLSRDQGASFANVFRGTLQGDSLSGDWADVPLGSTLSSGMLRLTGSRFPGFTPFRFVASERTGGFGGSEWEKLYNMP